MFIFKILTYLTGAATLGLFGYIYTVLDDKGMLDDVSRIPAEDITTFHIIAGVIIVWLLFGLVMKVISRGILIGLLVLALAAEGTFVGLNVMGDIQAEVPDLIKDQADGVLEKAKYFLN